VKKIAFVIVLLIAAGAFTAPKLVGDRAHQEYLKRIAEYPSGTSGVSFEHKSYEQSWFSSKAVTVMRIPLNSPKAKDFSVVLTSNIAHGPVVSTDGGIAFGLAYVKSNITLADLPAEGQKLADQYLPAGTVTVASLIDFNQLSNDVLHVGSISFKDEKASALFGGLNITGVSKLDYSLMKGKIELPASHFAADNFTADIADASGSYDQHKYRGLMMLGKTDLNFPQIKLVARQGAVTLEDFRIASNSEEQSGKLNITGNIGVRKITAPVPVTALQYDIEVNQLDARAIELWGEITRDMQAKPADPAMTLNNPKLRQFLELLLQNGLELKQLFTMDIMGGRLYIDWNTRFVGLPDGVRIDDKTDKALLLKTVDMHISVNIDEKALMATPLANMVTPYMQKGMIVKQGGKLVADIKLAEGVLTVNGISVPIEKTGK